MAILARVLPQPWNDHETLRSVRRIRLPSGACFARARNRALRPSAPVLKPASLLLLVGVSAVLLGGCFHANELRRQCVSECSRKNDVCVVHAMNAGALQQCDGEASECVRLCNQR